MEKISKLKDLDLKNIKPGESFYIEKNNILKKIITITSNRFDSVLSVNEIDMYMKKKKNSKFGSEYFQVEDYSNFNCYIYNDKNESLKILISSVFNIDDKDRYIIERNDSSLIKCFFEEIYNLKKLENSEILRHSYGKNNQFMDGICFKFNEKIDICFLTIFKTIGKELYKNKIYALINDDVIILFSPLETNENIKKVYNLCHKDKLIKKFIDDSNEFNNMDVMSIFKDKDAKQKFISICNSINDGFKHYQPFIEYDNVSYYNNFTFGPYSMYNLKRSYCRYFIEENGEIKPAENNHYEIASAFNDYFNGDRWKFQIFDPRDLNTLNEKEYFIDFNNDKLLRIKSKNGNGIFHYKKIKDLFVFDKTNQTKKEIEDCLKTYEKLLED